jgi:hypothetical protein
VAGSRRESIDGRTSAGLASPRSALAARQLSNSTFQSMSMPGTPPLSERAGWSGANTPGEYAGPEPDESASMAGDDREETEASTGAGMREIEGAREDEENLAGNIVTLTSREQKNRKGKGVEAELWRQVMEPVLGHWTVSERARASSTHARELTLFHHTDFHEGSSLFGSRSIAPLTTLYGEA